MEESAQWADSFGALARSYRQYAARQLSADHRARGRPAITASSRQKSPTAEYELFTAQPHGRARSESSAGLVERDIRSSSAGSRCARCISMPPATARLPVNTCQITAHGAEVRTLDEFFNRLIVIDRQAGDHPWRRGDEMALAIREKSLVAYLVDIFERSWERARPFTDSEAETAKTWSPKPAR